MVIPNKPYDKLHDFFFGSPIGPCGDDKQETFRRGMVGMMGNDKQETPGKVWISVFIRKHRYVYIYMLYSYVII